MRTLQKSNTYKVRVTSNYKMDQFNTGCMPNTDFRYEEFEGLLASAYLTAEAKYGVDSQRFAKAQALIGNLVEHYKLQSPKEAIANPRSREDWAQPKKLTPSFRISYSAYRDFGIRTDTEEFKTIGELESLL